MTANPPGHRKVIAPVVDGGAESDMLTFAFHIGPSRIPSAGKGLFTSEHLKKARVIIVPNQEHILHQVDALTNFPPDSIEHASSVRWFEEVHTVDPDWSEESHLNHSFEPNCLWHLGFVFALRDIAAGEELTIDYQNLLDENTVLEFKDSITGREIRGLVWREKMFRSSGQLRELFSAAGGDLP